MRGIGAHQPPTRRSVGPTPDQPKPAPLRVRRRSASTRSLASADDPDQAPSLRRALHSVRRLVPKTATAAGWRKCFRDRVPAPLRRCRAGEAAEKAWYDRERSSGRPPQLLCQFDGPHGPKDGDSSPSRASAATSGTTIPLPPLTGASRPKVLGDLGRASRPQGPGHPAGRPARLDRG